MAKMKKYVMTYRNLYIHSSLANAVRYAEVARKNRNLIKKSYVKLLKSI